MDERRGSKLSSWIAVSIYGSCCLSFVLLLHANWKGTIFEHQMRQKAWMEQWLIWAMCEGTSGTSRPNRWVRTRRRNHHRAIGKLCGGQNSTRHWTLLAQNRTHLYLSVPCQRIVALQVAEKWSLKECPGESLSLKSQYRSFWLKISSFLFLR